MQSRRLLVLFGSLLAVSCGFSGAPAIAITPFAIKATNVAMPVSGYGNSHYTVTGIPGAGTVTISCAYSGPATEAKIPQSCGPVGAPGIPVQAGETTFNGTVLFVPYGQAPPPGLGKLRGAPLPLGHLSAGGLALAGALMLGFGFRRRARRWLTLSLLAVGTLAGVEGISGCFHGIAMTPGIYPYTITAEWTASGPAILSQQATTTINVTMP